MQLPPLSSADPDLRSHWRSLASRGAAGLALTLLAGTYFLISPPTGATYPGAIPWSAHSLLKPLIDAMSLWGALPTARGAEIKELLFHACTWLGLGLLSWSAWRRGDDPEARPRRADRWLIAQGFFLAWVLLSGLSALWSTDPALAFGQASAYGLALGWGVALAWTIEVRHALVVLRGYVVIAVAGVLLCAWYFLERNPHHRPGFPLGSPSILGATTMVGLVLALGMLAGSLADRGTWWRRAGWLCAVVVLAFGMWLTGSRGALLGLLIALGTAVLFCVSGRTRWRLAVVGLVVLALSGWWLSTRANDLAMARGATIRFRAYAWRYAAELWSTRSISGHGAAAFPRLSGPLALSDRAADPAAFMGENVEHAHNELFEVFAEIGLIGGLIFVAGYVATIAGAAALLARNHSRPRRCVLLALVCAFVGLMADELFGVGLRLPGVPAVFYTLLGLLWALGRSLSRDDDSVGTDTLRAAHRAGCRVAAVAAALACVAAAWLGLQNARGVIHEQLADEAARADDARSGLAHAERAADLLLDPVRRLAALQRQLECRYMLADAAFQNWTRATAASASAPASSRASASDSPGAALRALALAEALACYEGAVRLHQRAPMFARATLAAALASERIADLGGDADTPADAWRERAWAAWMARRAQRPWEAQTLLALLRFPSSAMTRAILLRDALRDGLPGPEWFAALQRCAAQPDFEAAVSSLVDAAGPYDPRSDAATLILSGAPESLRLGASWAALHQDFTAAQQRSGRAAALYLPLQARLPQLYSVALAEQAEYAFLTDPRRANAAADVARRALQALPPIQEQKLEALAAPFRVRCAKYLLASGDVDGATVLLRQVAGEDSLLQRLRCELYVELVGATIRSEPADRPPVQRWIDAALRDDPRSVRAWGWLAWLAAESRDAAAFEQVLLGAARAGLSVNELTLIRIGVCQEYPEFCAAIP